MQDLQMLRVWEKGILPPRPSFGTNTQKLGQKGREEIKILMSHLVCAMIPNNEESGKGLLARAGIENAAWECYIM